MYYQSIHDTIDRITDVGDRMILQRYIAQLEERCKTVEEERHYLRNQVNTALRSMKFDLHPEVE